ncbi:hypothetical protein LTR37_014717 [Vermiconidia calcicola]|uniref:Uncharacterized protein n=1 Tax=Vermiconidia calcicola TaxID=1690605 RepID=A0ACC3MTI5_9PEZI|nr:hypothetical protein LTR37_014717 [Vermiconidia calcicola]
MSDSDYSRSIPEPGESHANDQKRTSKKNKVPKRGGSKWKHKHPLQALTRAANGAQDSRLAEGYTSGTEGVPRALQVGTDHVSDAVERERLRHAEQCRASDPFALGQWA